MSPSDFGDIIQETVDRTRQMDGARTLVLRLKQVSCECISVFVRRQKEKESIVPLRTWSSGHVLRPHSAVVMIVNITGRSLCAEWD
ncbi:hypothetical protein EYF80_050173 [Liparis tanakae]|uniref:Uncharacterized protein n=1 Tax=Liparis tanakae TaxID=230148 RepID=A0A4Z2FFJ8_9TELE|nr:hypothetical protein EYF80_050173 [Liparis tanakae]